MKKSRALVFIGLAAILLAFGLVLAGCGDGPSGGGGNKVTIKNSTTARIIGIYIEDAERGGDDIVGTDDEPLAVDIAPGATYTSPEISCEYVNLYVRMDLPSSGSGVHSAYWAVIEPGDFEVVVDDEWGYELRER